MVVKSRLAVPDWPTVGALYEEVCRSLFDVSDICSRGVYIHIDTVSCSFCTTSSVSSQNQQLLYTDSVKVLLTSTFFQTSWKAEDYTHVSSYQWSVRHNYTKRTAHRLVYQVNYYVTAALHYETFWSSSSEKFDLVSHVEKLKMNSLRRDLCTDCQDCQTVILNFKA